MKKLVILVSSKGKNVDLGNIIRKNAQEFDFETEMINLVDLNLPLFKFTSF